jgi:hypothetical protein
MSAPKKFNWIISRRTRVRDNIVTTIRTNDIRCNQKALNEVIKAAHPDIIPPDARILTWSVGNSGAYIIYKQLLQPTLDLNVIVPRGTSQGVIDDGIL